MIAALLTRLQAPTCDDFDFWGYDLVPKPSLHSQVLSFVSPSLQRALSSSTGATIRYHCTIYCLSLWTGTAHQEDEDMQFSLEFRHDDLSQFMDWALDRLTSSSSSIESLDVALISVEDREMLDMVFAHVRRLPTVASLYIEECPEGVDAILRALASPTIPELDQENGAARHGCGWLWPKLCDFSLLSCKCSPALVLQMVKERMDAARGTAGDEIVRLEDFFVHGSSVMDAETFEAIQAIMVDGKCHWNSHGYGIWGG